jgi:pimeloyl-ACP methyl ester carboxylesterase
MARRKDAQGHTVRTNLHVIMDSPARGHVESRHEPRIGTVRRRRIIYAEGYDPRGAEVYHRLFARNCDRFGKIWPVSVSVGPLSIDSDDLAHWSVELRTASWQVSTRYDFLRFEQPIRADVGGPIGRQITRALGWLVDDLTSGTYCRIFRASWRFGLHLLSIQLLQLAFLALAAVIGLSAYRIVVGSLAQPAWLGIAAAVVAALATLLALQPLARRWFVSQIINCWATLRRFGRGRATWIDEAIEAGARHLVETARANDADEIVVVGHSTGGVIATAIVARALALDPDLGRRGPRLVLLTLGSVMPAVALHPAAGRMREMVRRVANEPTLAWVECQSRKDVMNFANFDPVAGIGVDADRRPLLWPVRFKDMVSSAYYRRLRWNFFRMHFQYIMAGDRQTPYDYVLLVGVPMALADWAEHHRKLTLAFIQDGTAHCPRADTGATDQP